MARRMHRYIAATVLQAVAAVLICLLALVTLFTLVDELRDLTPGYTLRHALLYVLLSTPRRVYELLPYGVFLGVLVGLGTMASREEITVLRAAGVSVSRLFASVAAPALLLLALNQGLGEFVAPPAEAAGASLKLNVQRGDASGDIDSAYWLREGNLYTHIERFAANGELVGVHQFLWRDGALALSRYARRGRYDSRAGHWRLADVVETRIEADSTRVTSYASLHWRAAAEPVVFSAKALFEPARLSFADLAFQIEYLRREGLDATPYLVAFWSKVLQPAAVLGLVLLAVGFVIGPLREAGMGVRLTVGIAVGLIFKYLLDLFAPASLVFGIPPWLAMALPVLVCWAAGGALLRRV